MSGEDTAQGNRYPALHCLAVQFFVEARKVLAYRINFLSLSYKSAIYVKSCPLKTLSAPAPSRGVMTGREVRGFPGAAGGVTLRSKHSQHVFPPKFMRPHSQAEGKSFKRLRWLFIIYHRLSHILCCEIGAWPSLVSVVRYFLVFFFIILFCHYRYCLHFH